MMLPPFNDYESHYFYHPDRTDEEDTLTAVIAVCQAGGCFALLLFVAFLARLFPAISVFYWLMWFVLMISFAIGFVSSRRLRFLFLFLAAFASVFAGHWDGVQLFIQAWKL